MGEKRGREEPSSPAGMSNWNGQAMDTPLLVVDLNAMDRNIDRMKRALSDINAELGEAKRVKCRLHCKTGKSAEAALYIRGRMTEGPSPSAFAGVCCQTVCEAEAMLRGGVDDVLITNQVMTRPKLRRLAELTGEYLRSGVSLSVCVDSAHGVSILQEVFQEVYGPLSDPPRPFKRFVAKPRPRLGVLVECNVGGNRCGVDSPEDAAALAALIKENGYLRFAGIQAYNGSIQHVRSWKERQDLCERVTTSTKLFAETITASAGLDRYEREFLVTGAGSGTFAIEGRSGVLHEIQPGSFFFGDVDYGLNEWDEKLVEKFEPATFVLCTVISVSHQRRIAVVDCGLKAVSMDSGAPAVFGKCGDSLTYRPGGDEHGVLEVASGAAMPRVGDQFRLVPGHIDPTVALHGSFLCCRDERALENSWNIERRHVIAGSSANQEAALNSGPSERSLAVYTAQG